MAKVEYILDGKKVTLKDFISSVNNRITFGVVATVEQQVRGITCPTHNKHPDLEVSAKDGHVMLSVTGCCKEAEELLYKAIGGK